MLWALITEYLQAETLPLGRLAKILQATRIEGVTESF